MNSVSCWVIVVMMGTAIEDSTRRPLAGVEVILEGTKKQTTTDGPVGRSPAYETTMPAALHAVPIAQARPILTGSRSLRFSAPMRLARSAMATTGDRLWRARNHPPIPAIARAIGTTSIALSFVTASLSSSNVVGGAVMPARANMSLLYQMPSMPMRYGSPYCLPSTCQISAALPILPTSSRTWSVMSLR